MISTHIANGERNPTRVDNGYMSITQSVQMRVAVRSAVQMKVVVPYDRDREDDGKEKDILERR